MGMLVNGTWFDDDPLPRDSGGAFLRPDSTFRDRVTRDGSSGFKAAAGRYQLVTAPSCPWAHRTVLMRKLKRLDGAIPLLESDLPKGQGWAYSRGFDDLAPKGGAFHVHQVYSAAKSDYTGRATVPVLWDRETRTIVNNESSEIIRMLNAEFDDFGDPALDLYPPALRRDIDEINAFVYDGINNGVYRCGFATGQSAYEHAFDRLFSALDRVEGDLGQRAWLVDSHHPTEADWRLFTTLVRFDAVYFGHFKCNRNLIEDFPHLSRYLRALYRTPGIAATVNMDHIKRHYYMSHPHINPTRIVPAGPRLKFMDDIDTAALLGRS